MEYSILNNEGKELFSMDIENNISDEFVINATLIQYAIKNNVDLSYADFSNKDLKNISFYDINLTHAIFNNANLQNAEFNSVILEEASMCNSNLTYAEFENSSIRNCNFDSAKIEYTDFINCNLSGSNFNNTKLNIADFSNSFLASTKGINYAFISFDKHEGWRSTVLLAINMKFGIRFFCGDFIGNEQELRNLIDFDEENKESRLFALETVIKLIEFQNN